MLCPQLQEWFLVESANILDGQRISRTHKGITNNYLGNSWCTSNHWLQDQDIQTNLPAWSAHSAQHGYNNEIMWSVYSSVVRNFLPQQIRRKTRSRAMASAFGIRLCHRASVMIIITRVKEGQPWLRFEREKFECTHEHVITVYLSS